MLQAFRKRPFPDRVTLGVLINNDDDEDDYSLDLFKGCEPPPALPSDSQSLSLVIVHLTLCYPRNTHTLPTQLAHTTPPKKTTPQKTAAMRKTYSPNSPSNMLFANPHLVTSQVLVHLLRRCLNIAC